MPTKTPISCGFKTLRRIIISGSERAVTAIIKASTVPMAMPFSCRAATRGITPAALEYRGTPISTAIGTAKKLSFPA
jgi:hypothetical protein